MRGKSAARPSRNVQEMILTDELRQTIHNAACAMVAAAVDSLDLANPRSTLGDAAALEVSGAFVTLKREGKLRSCYGTYGGPYALHDALTGAAVGAAKKDPRFPDVTADELPGLHLEVSLLHSIEAIRVLGQDRALHVEIGKHGLTIRLGDRSGLLLPRVAVDMNLSAAAFLAQICRKAQLAHDAWLDAQAQLQTFQAACVGGPFAMTG